MCDADVDLVLSFDVGLDVVPVDVDGKVAEDDSF